MTRSQTRFLYLNIGHYLDHLFMLIFASVAALRLTTEWNIHYADLIPYATPSFVAFGVGAIASGWIADKWSREGMMTIFFIGIGVSAILAGLANSPLQMAVALALVGLFASIYHPVGLSMVVEGLQRTGVPIAINGVFGNMGVASAALITGLLVDRAGWESAFVFPGIVSILLGIFYWRFNQHGGAVVEPEVRASTAKPKETTVLRKTLIRVFGVIFFTTAVGGLIFQSTTFALPKVLDERLSDLAGSATLVGWYAFLVFALAAFAQLLVGYLIDRYPVRVIFSVVALLQALFFFVMTGLTGASALIVSFAFMFVVFGQIPINDVLVGRMAKSEWRSRAYALRYLVTFTVMASSVPFIGWVYGNWGFDRLFQILSVAGFIIFLATLLLPGSKDRVQNPA